MKIKYDDSKNRYANTYKQVVLVAKAQQRVYSERVRDMMKEEFHRMTHNSVYGSKTPISQSSKINIGNQGIVVSTDSKGNYVVGPKKGNVYNSTYGRILGVIHEGHDFGEPTTFRLPKHREAASKDGFWTVTSLPSRPFAQSTMRRLERSEGKQLFQRTFEADISRISGVTKK